ncbi:phosphate transporter [Mitosporidium daphniae]|uniref:Phosphate transporter n=1 Tax=Mitosporidium daphniae TaxID=1485682 RepID=A0A098VSC8_9MICR|nr:phosphate transporter [Mitosporidium daphniae]KGG50656.1 phosphate transporter [Mitosporidium daphniae]|eukprot:XP_013237140.1 phosphate transporter [Mitosporidium daphniae]
MTIEEYDSTNLLELVKQNLLNCAFLLFLHLKFEYTQPLILQAILPLKSFLSAPIVKIHLLGFPAVGDLSRPFPLPKSPFAAFFQNEQEEGVTDAPARTEQKSVEKSSEAQNDTLRMRKKGTPSNSKILTFGRQQ